MVMVVPNPCRAASALAWSAKTAWIWPKRSWNRRWTFWGSASPSRRKIQSGVPSARLMSVVMASLLATSPAALPPMPSATMAA
jgi:hypothetical protein